MQKNHFIKIRELIVQRTFNPEKAESGFFSEDRLKENYDYTFINIMTVKEIRYAGDLYPNLSYYDLEYAPYQIRTIDGQNYLTSKVFVKDLLGEWMDC